MPDARNDYFWSYMKPLDKEIQFRELKKMRIAEFQEETTEDNWRDVDDNSIVKIGDCILLVSKNGQNHIAIECVTDEPRVSIEEIDIGYSKLIITNRPRIRLRRVYHD